MLLLKPLLRAVLINSIFMDLIPRRNLIQVGALVATACLPSLGSSQNNSPDIGSATRLVKISIRANSQINATTNPTAPTPHTQSRPTPHRPFSTALPSSPTRKTRPAVNWVLNRKMHGPGHSKCWDTQTVAICNCC